MSNLTRELRHFANAWCVLGNADLFTDAADEIDRLREENARLRDVLRMWARWDDMTELDLALALESTRAIDAAMREAK